MGGGHHDGEAQAVMVATEQEMSAAGLDLQWRDFCAHKLIPLNKCRRQNLYSPFKCEDERHGYEKCMYDQYQRRVKEMGAEIKAARAAKLEREESSAATSD